jgi:tetratricopeptide (TPR) repeat protein
LVAKVMVLDPGNPTAKSLLKQVDRKTLLATNYTRGVEAYSREDYALAIQYLQGVYEIDPHYRDVNFLYRDAQSHYLPLESMSKESTELYAKGVEAYIKGDFPKAVDYWGQVLEKNPKNFLVRRNLEEAKTRMKDKPAPAGGSAAH